MDTNRELKIPDVSLISRPQTLSSTAKEKNIVESGKTKSEKKCAEKKYLYIFTLSVADDISDWGLNLSLAVRKDI